jgi:hypothetical protein
MGRSNADHRRRFRPPYGVLLKDEDMVACARLEPGAKSPRAPMRYWDHRHLLQRTTIATSGEAKSLSWSTSLPSCLSANRITCSTMMTHRRAQKRESRCFP